MQPAFETVLDVVAACGYELDFVLKPLDVSPTKDEPMAKNLVRSPQDRVKKLLRALHD